MTTLHTHAAVTADTLTYARFMGLLAHARALAPVLDVILTAAGGTWTVADESGTYLPGVRVLAGQNSGGDLLVGISRSTDEDCEDASDLPDLEDFYVMVVSAYTGDVVHVTSTGAGASAVCFDDGLSDYARAVAARIAVGA